jgi:hypothetical protein
MPYYLRRRIADSKTTTKSSTNPKKPAVKNTSAPDKIKTDERMSTRGVKPPPGDADTPQ